MAKQIYEHREMEREPGSFQLPFSVACKPDGYSMQAADADQPPDVYETFFTNGKTSR